MHINLKSIWVRFPIYDAKQRSFKRTMISAATGGKISTTNKITFIEALQDISLHIQEGERVALIGHNGSGKTTLLRVIAGVYTPVSGQVDIKGKITSLLDSRLGMDYDSTGFENIRLRGMLLGLSPKHLTNFIDQIIEFSELGDFLNMPVRTYSSGMVLRLAFSISTCIEPEILLMDEWLNVGDDAFKKKAEGRLDSFVKKAGILVFANHEQEIVDQLATRQIFLEHGKIVS